MTTTCSARARKYLTTVLLVLLSARADAASQDRLVSLREGGRALDVASLAPLLERNALLLLEDDASGQLKQVVVLSVVDLPAAEVMRRMSSPRVFIGEEANGGAMKHRFLSRSGPNVDLHWQIKLPLMLMEGRRRLVPEPPHRLRIVGLDGHAVHLQEMWEAYALPGERSVLAHHRFVDVAQMSKVGRRFVEFDPYSLHGINAASGYAAVRHYRWLVEHLGETQGHIEQDSATHGGHPTGHVVLRPLAVEDDPRVRTALEPLLARGMLAAVSSFPDGHLEQVVVMRLARAPVKTVLDVAVTAERWSEFFPRATVTSVERRDGGVMRVSTEVDVPFMDLDLVSDIVVKPPDTVDATSAPGGDIETGAWRWRLLPPSGADGRTLAMYYMYSNLGEVSWFAKKLIEAVPTMAHGMNLSSGVVIVEKTCREAERQHATATARAP
jgi:hypothetical protein